MGKLSVFGVEKDGLFDEVYFKAETERGACYAWALRAADDTELWELEKSYACICQDLKYEGFQPALIEITFCEDRLFMYLENKNYPETLIRRLKQFWKVRKVDICKKREQRK